MEEIWKDIPKSDWLYQASNLWNIRSVDCSVKYRRWWLRKVKWRIKKCRLDNRSWYLATGVKHNWKQDVRYIHIMVAETFLEKPEYKCEVNHKDWDKKNNKLDNLERVTHKENVIHSFKVLWRKSYLIGRFWKEHNTSKSVAQYTIDGDLIKIRDSISDVYRELWYNVSNISRCCKWDKNYSHVKWYKWKYASYLNQHT